MTLETHILPNGIRLIHKQDNSPVAYCGIAVNTGTRDENENEQGLAHFVEHMLFKGTAKRKAWHILNQLESVGGEINAYTTKEETFVYSTVLKEDFERAMELTSDIFFNSTFPEKEMEKEIDIVLEEINSDKDNPSDLIFDDFEGLLYEGYPMGRNILGKAELLEKYTPENLKSFVAENYYTTEIVFFSLGNIDFSKIIRLAHKYLAIVPYSARKRERKTPIVYTPKKILINKNTHQAHYMIGNRAYNLHEEKKRLPMYLLNNILGGSGMNSILNLALRERNGLVYNVESNFTSYSDTGIWNIYFGCDEKNLNRCEKLVNNELTKFREKRISETQLQKSKKQIIGEMLISSENKENLILSIGKSFLHYNKVDSIEEIKEQIYEITSQEIQETANEIFDKEKLTTLIYT